MAFEFKTGQFTAQAGAGSQAVTGVGFQPKALIIWTTTASGLTTIASQFIGATDGSNQGSLHVRSEHGLAASSGALVHSNSSVFQPSNSAGVPSGRAGSISSFDSDGFTISWSTSGATFPINYIAIGGDELTNAHVSARSAPSSTGNQAYDSTGFQPDALIAFGGSHPFATSGRAIDPVSWFLGWTDGTNEGVIGSANDDESDPMDTFRICRSDRFISTLNGATGAVHNQASLVSLDSDGFTLNWDVANTQDVFFVLALKGGKYKAGVETAPDSSATKATTGLGFEPSGVLLQSAGVTPSSSLVDHVSRCMGAGDGTNDTTTAYTDEDNVGTTVTRRYMSATEALNFRSNDGTSTVESATFDSLDSDGFTLNWGAVDGSERSFLYFAMGSSGEQTAGSTLELDQDVEVTLVVSESAVSTLSLTQEASVTGPIEVEASNTLSLSQSADAAGPKTVSAQSNIVLAQTARIPEEIKVSANSPLALTQQVIPSGPKSAVAESKLTLVDFADTQQKVRAAESQLVLAQDVEVLVSKHAKNVLVLSQEADRTLIGTGLSQLLDLSHEAKIPEQAESQLTLAHSATFAPFTPASLVKSKLILTQEARANGTLGKLTSNVLTLAQAVAVIHERPGAKCLGLTIPPDNPSFTQGVKLSGVGDWTSPRSMNLDDIDRIQSDRINRESRGGTLLVFADALWPQTETLLYSVSAIKRPVAHELLDFLSDNLGTPVTLTTHEGHQWTGLVINPDTAVIEDQRGSFTVQLEFEGTEV